MGAPVQTRQRRTARDSGSRLAITTMATLGKSSDTRVIKEYGAAAQMATREGGRNSAGNAEGRRKVSSCRIGPRTWGGQHVDVRLMAEDGIRRSAAINRLAAGRDICDASRSSALRTARFVALPI